MEIRWEIFLILLGAALVTFMPRVLPLMILSKMIQIPQWGIRWLNYIPISIMAALAAQELLIQDGKFALFTNHLELTAALPTLLVAIWTRSLLGTVIVGIVSIMLLRLWF